MTAGDPPPLGETSRPLWRLRGDGGQSAEARHSVLVPSWQLRRYLVDTGWADRSVDDHGMHVFTRDDSRVPGGTVVVAVAEHDAAEASQVDLAAVAFVEGRDVSELAMDLSSGGADVVAARLLPTAQSGEPLPSGQAPLQLLRRAVEGLDGLFDGASFGVDDDAEVPPNRRPARQAQWLSRVRVAAEPGSFILNVLCPIDEEPATGAGAGADSATLPREAYDADLFEVPSPTVNSYGRRVVDFLHQAVRGAVDDTRAHLAASRENDDGGAELTASGFDASVARPVAEGAVNVALSDAVGEEADGSRATRAAGAGREEAPEPLDLPDLPGVNVLMLEALSDLGGRAESGYQLRFAWSPRVPHAVRSDLIEVSPEVQRVFRQVAELLRLPLERGDVRVEGAVTNLQRDRILGPGKIVVAGTLSDEDDDKVRRVAVTLGEQDYLQAVAAHRAGSRVQVSGTLVRNGTRLSLRAASGFAVLADLFEPDA